MQADSLPRVSSKSFVYLAGHGLAYGALAGIVSAEIYMVGITVVALIVVGPAALPMGMLVIILGQFYGVLPAAIVGAVSGVVIGTAFFFLRDYLSVQTGPLWGLLIALLMAGPPVLMLAVLPNPDPAPALILGMPIVVLYLFSGAWGGHKLAGGTFRMTSAQRKALVILLGVLAILVLDRAAAALVIFLIYRK